MSEWQRDWRTLYLLNDAGVNKFDMTVQPGRRDGDQGSVKYTECEDVAKMTLVALNAHAGLVEAAEQALAILNEWPPSEWGYRETQIADRLSSALAAARASGAICGRR
jgi:hypothetical protein